MVQNRWLRSNRPANVRETEDRVGDYLVALYYDFITAHRDCRHGLNIRGNLSAYESERRVLVKLASTGSVVSILLRFGRVLESYLEVLNIPKSEELMLWRNKLNLERQERAAFFQKMLKDEQELVNNMGDECQQMDILTLLKRDLERYEDILTPKELDVMSEVYDRMVHHSGIVAVGPVPSWFLSPNEVISDAAGCFLDDVRVTKCSTGGSLDPQVCWEHKEESCLREAATWSDLNHPHVVKMLGGCHIGKQPFLVHEPAESMINNRANAHTWKPLLGWALGLQYLHERELGYKNFEKKNLLVRYFVTSSGILSGLGLVPVKRQSKASLKRGVSDVFNMIELAASLPTANDKEVLSRQATWSVPDDIFAFGMAIYNTRQRVTMHGDHVVHELPRNCPPFLEEREWDLIQKMCVKALHERVNMWYVVHQLQSFVTASEANNKTTPVDFSVTLDSEDDPMEEEDSYKPEKIDDFIVAEMHAKVVEAMPRLIEMYQDMPKASEMLGHVLDRLSSVRLQLQVPEFIDDATVVMQGFADLLNQFYTLIGQHQSEKIQTSSSIVADFCKARAAAQRISGFHHEIDRLMALAGLRDTPVLNHEPPTRLTLLSSHASSSDSSTSVFDIHVWKEEWNIMRRQQLRDFQKCLENMPELKQMLINPIAREEAQMLLQFEANKRRASYPDSVLEAIAKALQFLEELDGGEPAEMVPSWFIPPYEVELGSYIGQGGFAHVYYGKWFDTDVVVKILKSQSQNEPIPTSNSSNNDEDPVDVFRREADHWFMLSHQNVVHLYGACHVGRSFFVCEPAKTTSFSAHVRSLALQNPGYNPKQISGKPSDIMRCLYLVGLGLKYLHERGIIHSDLKQNNFMVGTDEKNIKLGDFGLSVMKRRGGNNDKDYAVSGAYRWKAPECLLGAEPSVESDIFGFGMCILEIFSGAFPWGNNLIDAAVKFYVTKRKQLPPRPRGLNDIQWSMVQRMCCFEPSERISLEAVVDMLRNFRYEEPTMRCN